MIEEGFKYWFTDHEKLRSPFPEAIREELQTKTSEKFHEWLLTIGEEEAQNLPKDQMVEMFEMFLFNVGVSLCEDPEQKITIIYPFMPRCGDEVDDVKNGLSEVTRREIVDSELNKKQLRLFLKRKSDESIWQTEFDLPA